MIGKGTSWGSGPISGGRTRAASDQAGAPGDTSEQVLTIGAMRQSIVMARLGEARGPQQCRLAFLAHCWDRIGPTQREHLTGHCLAVSELAVRLGRAMGETPETLERLQLAGLLHDIGKCAVPESLLTKPFALTPEERSVMSHHARIGAEISAGLGADEVIVNFVRHHHTPYRDSFSGQSAAHRPLSGARLICVADALISMTTRRSYCDVRSTAAALAELRRCAGRQFDPRVVELAESCAPCVAA